MYTVTATVPSGGGTVTHTTTNNGVTSAAMAFFQLPVGYRPNQTETAGAGRMYAVDGFEQSCVVGVSYDGYVVMRHGKTSGTWISVSGYMCTTRRDYRRSCPSLSLQLDLTYCSPVLLFVPSLHRRSARRHQLPRRRLTRLKQRPNPSAVRCSSRASTIAVEVALHSDDTQLN